VVTMVATTFGTRAALGSALVGSLLVSAMIIFLSKPEGSVTTRLQVAGFWAWLLLGSAALAGGHVGHGPSGSAGPGRSGGRSQCPG
jgi:hypothetical protein